MVNIFDLYRYKNKEITKGIYFLFNNERLVHIGKSNNIHKRVEQSHIEFTSYSIIEINNTDELNRLYSIYKDAYPIAKNRKKEILKDRTNNTLLIDQLYQVYKFNKLKRGFVFQSYLEKANTYCRLDLQHIANLVGYRKKWITHQTKELEESEKWKLSEKS